MHIMAVGERVEDKAAFEKVFKNGTCVNATSLFITCTLSEAKLIINPVSMITDLAKLMSACTYILICTVSVIRKFPFRLSFTIVEQSLNDH